MKIILSNGVELSPIMVMQGGRFVYGANRDTLKIEVYYENGDRVESIASYEREAVNFSQDYKSYFIDRERGLVGLMVTDWNGNKGETGDRYILLAFDGYKLVILPDATSSAVHIFIVSLLMLFLSGVRIVEISKVFIISVALGLLVIFTIGRGDTVVSRLKDYANGSELTRKERLEKDTYRSRMAIQNGGFFGEGAGRSVMRGRLMHPESDYIFAVIVEEFGLVVSMVIIMLYLWLFFRSLRIFEKCEWLYGGLLAVGMALLITSQAYLHVGVATGLLPETGQNLPFLTQGRTGMFCASIALGIILGISRQVEQGTLVPPSQQPNNKHI